MTTKSTDRIKNSTAYNNKQTALKTQFIENIGYYHGKANGLPSLVNNLFEYPGEQY